MSMLGQYPRGRWVRIVSAGWLSLLLLIGAAALPAGASETLLQQGERMYRAGQLPSGEPIRANFGDDVPILGTTFACVSCHTVSGFGAEEGRVLSPPVTGPILFQPRTTSIEGSVHVPSFHNYAVLFPVRPAYTDATLATAIRDGVDPTGRTLMDVMPRYQIDNPSMVVLINYLRHLSSEVSPGVTKDELNFATVIVEGSDPLAVESMIAPLQFSVDRKNVLATAAAANDRVARMAYNMLGPDLLAKRFTLSRWTLKGPASTWRAQLEDYYRKEPVFALLGGISPGEWEPVHRFCEDNRIPNLFPVVDYPVLSDTDWYTHYLSRGVSQEAETAANYLYGMVDLIQGQTIVQVVRESRKGLTLAAGFRGVWADAGQPSAIEIVLAEGEKLTAKRLQQIVADHKPAALFVWDDAGALPAIEALAKQKQRPGIVFASGTYLGDSLWSIPEEARDLLYLTYPYRLPQEEIRYDNMVRKVVPGKKAADFNQQVLKQSYVTGEILGQALMMMRAEYYRDFLFDTIDMMEDMQYPLYERIGFAPNQRYASKGCYIVQLDKGDNPQLQRRSTWVTY